MQEKCLDCERMVSVGFLREHLLSVAKAGSGLVVQQHLVVGYKACTSYMQLLLPYHHNTSTANY